MSAHQKVTPTSIELKLQQIRALMAQMQQDEGSLDHSLQLYREATDLIAECQRMLEEVAQSITDVTGNVV
jgi:exodeoxyribonuclease VII small subunit